MRVLITGATGMLGSKVFEELISNKELQIFTTSRSKFAFANHIIADLTNPRERSQLLELSSPEFIVHCAAMVNVNECEKKRDLAYSLHVESTGDLAAHSNVRKFIYISTDSVYDGTKGGYIETDIVEPTNYYAQTKYEGEQSVVRNCSDHYILRTNILGYTDPLKGSLYEWAYSSLKKGEQIEGFDNVYFNPLYTADLAGIIGQFIKLLPTKGVYHVASKGAISKYEFIRKVVSGFSFDPKQVHSVSLDAFSQAAKRPLNTTLAVEKLIKVGIQPPKVNQTIENLIEDFNNKMQNHGK